MNYFFFGISRCLIWAGLCLVGAGCSIFEEKEDRLPGERIDALPLTNLNARENYGEVIDRTVYLPRAKVNSQWLQKGGTAAHSGGHWSLPENIDIAWQRSVGDGSDISIKLLAPPVVAQGRVFTIDTGMDVRAFDLQTGELIWQKYLDTEDDPGLIGGLIGYANNKVFIGTGDGFMIALSDVDGAELWRKKLSAPIRSGPTLYDGKIFLVTLNNQTIALDQDNGEQLWLHIGIGEKAAVLSAANPAAARGVIITVYPSGEVYALRADNGSILWSDIFTSSRQFDASTFLTDIAAMPVVKDDRLYILSLAGRLIGLNLDNGARIWERDIGGAKTPWLVGDYLYVISNQQHLLCLDRHQGIVLWATVLQRYEDVEDQENPITWTGPIVAGDRLIIAGSHGKVVAFSPWTGSKIAQIEVDDSVQITPIIANKTLLLLSDEADLTALR